MNLSTLEPTEASIAWLPAKSPARLYLVLLGIVSLFYVSTARAPKLFDQIDGQYAGAAREMLASGDYLVPTQDGVPRLQKPPLTYWLELASFRLFGVSEFAARFPLVLVTIGWFLVTGALGWRLSGRLEVGALAALMLATSLGSYLFTHLVMPEPLLALTMASTMYCLVAAQGALNPRRIDRWLLAAWACMACGALTKGLHAVAFPLLAAGLSALIRPDLRPLWKRFALRPHGWAIVALALVPWYVAMEVRYPGFLLEHLWNEQIGHIYNHRWPPDSDRVPLLLFWSEHLGFFLPWTAFLAVFAGTLLRRIRVPGAWRRGGWHFLWLWLLVNSVTIIFSSIQDYYLLVSWPILAIGAAEAFTAQEQTVRVWRVSGIVLAVFGIAGFLLAWRLALLSQPSLPPVAAESGHTTSAALGGSPVIGWIGRMLWVAGAICGSAGAIVYGVARRKLVHWIVATTTCCALSLLALSAGGLTALQDEFSCYRLARAIQQTASGPYQVICACEANDLTSLFFYLPHQVHWVHANPEAEFPTRVLGLGRALYLSEDDVKAAWARADQSTYLIIPAAQADTWRKILGAAPDAPGQSICCGPHLLLMRLPARAQIAGSLSR